jgi:hypothetical protein
MELASAGGRRISCHVLVLGTYVEEKSEVVDSPEASAKPVQ